MHAIHTRRTAAKNIIYCHYIINYMYYVNKVKVTIEHIEVRFRPQATVSTDFTNSPIPNIPWTILKSKRVSKCNLSSTTSY